MQALVNLDSRESRTSIWGSQASAPDTQGWHALDTYFGTCELARALVRAPFFRITRRGKHLLMPPVAGHAGPGEAVAPPETRSGRGRLGPSSDAAQCCGSSAPFSCSASLLTMTSGMATSLERTASAFRDTRKHLGPLDLESTPSDNRQD